jgi:hypothetical protein
MSKYQSSSTFQNSVISWTFKKEKRFQENKLNSDKIYDIKADSKNRYTTIGYGNRSDFVSAKGRYSPSPTDYNITSIFDKNQAEKKGFIIGKKYSNPLLNTNPGVGSYNINNKNKGFYPITVKSRQFFFYGKKFI